MNNAEAIPPSGSIQLDIIIEASAWNMCEFDLQTQTHAAVVATLQQLNFFCHCPVVEIAILLADDNKLQELNHSFRNVDKPTNVLSFPAYDALKPQGLATLTEMPQIFLGDIAISYERIITESLEQNKPFHAHYIHMIVHSVLHLLGYDHEEEEDAQTMENLEIQILHNLNITNPYIIN